jgi:chromosome segregation ATPase
LLGWLARELPAATARLVTVQERVVELVASGQRTERELAACRAQVAELSEARSADQEQIRALETKRAQQHERVAAARAQLADADRTLNG